MAHDELIGKKVISSEFGVGTVVSLDDMGGRIFLAIEGDTNRAKTFVPADSTDSYRVVCSESQIATFLDSLSAEKESLSFDSKKDRINYFKIESKKQGLKQICDLLIELHSLDDRGQTEEQVFQKLIDTFALEHSIITGEEIDASKELIAAKLNRA